MLLTQSHTRKREPRGLAEVGIRAAVRFRTCILNPDGRIAKRRKFQRNLTLDGGLDGIASRSWAESIKYAAVGTGTNPVKRDSGSVTFSRSGTTVTASASFFEAADANRLLKFDSGEEMYILSFTSGTEVQVNTSGALAASEGTVHYVNRTALQTEVKRTNTCRTSSGDNGSTWSAVNKTWTHKRTFLFSAEAGSVTYTEIGWSWDVSPTALFGMALISGGGDSLVAGQQYLVVMELVLTLSPASSVAAPDVGSGGWNTAGNISLECVQADAGYGFSSIDASGNTVNAVGLEPSANTSKFIGLFLADFTLGSATTDNVTVTPTNSTQVTLAGYTTGSFTRTFSVTFSVGQGNGTIYGVGVVSGSGTSQCFLRVKFTTPQTKANTHTLTVTFRLTWGRTLVN